MLIYEFSLALQDATYIFPFYLFITLCLPSNTYVYTPKVFVKNKITLISKKKKKRFEAFIRKSHKKLTKCAESLVYKFYNARSHFIIGINTSFSYSYTYIVHTYINSTKYVDYRHYDDKTR